jgi:GNAT superfamily N-acetyltransferase
MPRVRIATTTSEIEMALRLRYSVFYLEGGDTRYADHSQALWIDKDDGPNSHLLIAVDDSDNVIGTIRVTVLRDCDFIGHAAYDFNVLASYVGIPLNELRNRIARIDRGVVAKTFRRLGIRSLLQTLAEQTALSHGCDVLVASNATSNAPARLANQKLGWTEYPVVGTHAGFTAQSIFKLLPSRPE